MRTDDDFWSRVARGAGCWEWVGTRNARGYGLLRREGRLVRAHRVAWELTNGPIPEGRSVLHACDNPPCVNPAHLRVGTQRENMADMDSRSRRFSPFRGQVQRGSSNRYAKLRDEDIPVIRARRASGELLRVIAADYGVDPSAICYAVRRGWRHVG